MYKCNGFCNEVVVTYANEVQAQQVCWLMSANSADQIDINEFNAIITFSIHFNTIETLS
jgi:hypothetical protein